MIKLCRREATSILLMVFLVVGANPCTSGDVVVKWQTLRIASIHRIVAIILGFVVIVVFVSFKATTTGVP